MRFVASGRRYQVEIDAGGVQELSLFLLRTILDFRYSHSCFQKPFPAKQSTGHPKSRLIDEAKASFAVKRGLKSTRKGRAAKEATCGRTSAQEQATTKQENNKMQEDCSIV